jgi:hypothetical protein
MLIQEAGKGQDVAADVRRRTAQTRAASASCVGGYGGYDGSQRYFAAMQ